MGERTSHRWRQEKNHLGTAAGCLGYFWFMDGPKGDKKKMGVSFVVPSLLLPHLFEAEGQSNTKWWLNPKGRVGD